MEIGRVYAVYFSATGTTEKVVCRAAEAAVRTVFPGENAGDGEPVRVCFNSPEFRRQELSFGEGDLVFFGVPVYAGRVPNLLLPYLKEKIRGSGAAAVPVVLYGNRNFDDALKELVQILEKAGFLTAAAGSFVGEHAFSRLLGAGRPDQEDLALAESLGKEAAEKVMSGAWPENPHVPASVPGNEPIRPYYTPRDRNGNPIDILKVRPETDPEKCAGCGLCAELCPLGSISREDPSEITGICMKCGACIKKCPQGAKFISDAGYLYHRKELEEVYQRRALSGIYVS